MQNKKQKSSGNIYKNNILPSFRSVGCKPCDFHRLKYSTNYNNFPKLRSSSLENIEKEQLNINFNHELKKKKKVISFQRKKFDYAVDKWKQRYGQKNNKQDQYLPNIPKNIQKIQSNSSRVSPQSINNKGSLIQQITQKIEQESKKSLDRFHNKSMIRGNSLGIENRQQMKPILDLKLNKPNLGIKWNKKNRSQKLKRKQIQAIPQRWEINQEDHQYLGL